MSGSETFFYSVDQAPQNYNLSSLVLYGFSSKKETIFLSTPFHHSYKDIDALSL